jgi:hypothetical protein
VAQKTFPANKSTVRAKHSEEKYARDGGGERHLLAGSEGGFNYTSYVRFATNWSGVKQIQSAYLVLTTKTGAHTGFPRADSGILISRMTSSFPDPNDDQSEGEFKKGSYTTEGKSTVHDTNGVVKSGADVITRINVTELVNDMAPKTVKDSHGKPGRESKYPHHGWLIQRRTTSKQSNPRMCVGSDKHANTQDRPYIELNYIPTSTANVATPTNPIGNISDILGESFEGTFDVGANQPADVKLSKVQLELFKSGGTTPVWSYDAAASPSDVLGFSFTVPLSRVGTTGSQYKFVSGQGYDWRVRLLDNKGIWTAWSAKRAFGLLTNPPVLTNLKPASSPPLATLNNVYFSADFSDPDGNRLLRFQVQLRTQTSPTDPAWEDDLLWDSGSVDGAGWAINPKTGLPGGSIKLPYGGIGLDPGTYSWRMQAWDGLEASSDWVYSQLTLTKGYEPDPGEVDLLTGYAQRKLKARILIRGMLNKVQTVQLSDLPDSGSFKLTFAGQQTAAIAYNASAATMEARLEALSNLDPGDVAVTKSGTKWTITFSGQWAGKNVPKLTAQAFTFSPSSVYVNCFSDRAPGKPVAIIEDAANIGASEMFNSGGEFYFSLPAIHPQVPVIEPYQVHYALEHFRGESWREVAAGIITDFDATDNDVVFYGQDYMAILARQVDERFNPTATADAAAKLWPETGGGSKYVNRTIKQIVKDQLDRSINDAGSPLAFFTTGTIDPMDESISIFVSFKERLPFIAGLIESHRAGTGKRTRVMVQKSATGVYSWVVKDTAGRDRPNIRMEYGGLVQGFRVVPFGQFSTRLNAIGRIYNQSKMEYYVAHAPTPSGQDASYFEEVYGRFATATTYQDITDLNDLKRRAKQAAGKMTRVGKALALHLRPGALHIKDGWDICDSIFVDINRGVVHTTRMGSGYWTIWGWTWELAPTGEETITLSVLPKEDSSAANPDLIPSEPVNADKGDWQIEARDPDDILDVDVFTHVNSNTGHIFQRDTTNGGWIDRTTELPYAPVILNDGSITPPRMAGDYRATFVGDILPSLPSPDYPAGSMASMPGTAKMMMVSATADVWEEYVGAEGPPGPPGPPGGQGLRLGQFNWSTTRGGTPASMQVRLFANPVAGVGNNFRVSDIEIGGNNRDPYFQNLKAGDLIYVDDQNGHVISVPLSAAPIDHGTWWELPFIATGTYAALEPPNNANVTMFYDATQADTTPPDVPTWVAPPDDLVATTLLRADGVAVSGLAMQWNDLPAGPPNDDLAYFELRIRQCVKDMPKGWHAAGQPSGSLGIGEYYVMVAGRGDNGLPSMGVVQQVDVALASSKIELTDLATSTPPTLTNELAVYIGTTPTALYYYGDTTTGAGTFDVTSLGTHQGDPAYLAPTVSKATFTQLDTQRVALASDYLFETFDNDRWHWVTIRSVDETGNRSAWSEERGVLSARDLEPPTKPTGVRAINGNKRIGVTFNAVFESDLNRYEVRWKFSEGNVVPDWDLIPWNYDISLTNQFSFPVDGYGLVIGNVRSVDNTGNVVGGTADDLTLGWDDDGFTGESSPIPPEELAVEELFATYAHLVNIDASQIVSGTLTVREDPGNPGAISIYNAAGLLAGRWDPTGWYIINTAEPTQAIRAKDGIISFTKSGVVGQQPWQWPEAVWTTAIGYDGINADYITTGAIKGGHNRLLNSGFEIAPSAGPKTTLVYDTAAEWDAAGAIVSSTNKATGQAALTQQDYGAP